jgi:hypothetical protein
MPTYSESSWKQKIPPNNIDVEKLIADWKLPPLYALLLANRGIASTARSIFDGWDAIGF